MVTFESEEFSLSGLKDAGPWVVSQTGELGSL